MTSMSLELEETPDKTDEVLYAIMGDMFELEMLVERDVLTVKGSKYQIWSWLTFQMWYTLGRTAPS